MATNKQREALESIVAICDGDDAGGLPERMAIYNLAKAALAEPPRNCDIGTPEEQYERHKAYCEKRRCMNDIIYSCRTCFGAWAQMPYEAGQKGGGK